MPQINRVSIVNLLIVAASLLAACSGPNYPGPLTPEEALGSFQLREGFAIEVFASEPYINDPVDVEFDEFGNFYVVEMLDYPDKPPPGRSRSRIRYLEDTDGDGRFDNSIIFKDSLNEATSILTWKQGLLVCAAPHILYLKDTDGDMISDTEEVLFTGFFANNSEAQITNLKFNVDNWIYASNYGHPGEIEYLRRPQQPAVSIQGTDFRFRLDNNSFEPAAGSTQFGQAIDDWGNRFGTQNTVHLSQIVVPWRYLVRDATIATKAPVENISDHDLDMFQLTPAPYWRAERTRRRQKSYEEQNLDRIEWAEDHFTGSAGGTVYNGDLFPKQYQGSVFTGEVAGNLVHRDQLSRGKGPLYVAARATEDLDSEFLASTDSWFRPANMEVAPDGSLLVVDMYRQHIETPLSIPEDLKEDMDFYNGEDKGRVYRIFPEKTNFKDLVYPGEMSTKELVTLLEHPHGWWRLTAQRLLIERNDPLAINHVVDRYEHSESPVARLHAMYVLEALGGITEEIILRALQDAHPQLRKRGIQFAEEYSNLLPEIIDLADDQDIDVVFQVALSLGYFQGEEVDQALERLSVKYADDPWFQKAIQSSIKTHQ